MADDDMLAAFVKPDFDSKDFVHTVVRRDSVSDDLAHLRQGIAVLESQLREQVVSHHGRLIEQVSHAKDLEVLVDTVTSGVSRLQASLGSVRAKIREPYEVVASKTAQLERLQAAGEVLRAVLRVRDFSKKLEMHMSAASAKADSNAMKDLAQAASCLSEIRACMARRDLAGVEEVDKRQKWLEECNGTIFSKSQKVLLEAVLMRQQQDMANSLQVFCSLDALPAAVEAALAELTRLARSAASSTVDTSTLPLDPEDQKGWTSKQRARRMPTQLPPGKPTCGGDSRPSSIPSVQSVRRCGSCTACLGSGATCHHRRCLLKCWMRNTAGRATTGCTRPSGRAFSRPSSTSLCRAPTKTPSSRACLLPSILGFVRCSCSTTRSSVRPQTPALPVPWARCACLSVCVPVYM